MKDKIKDLDAGIDTLMNRKNNIRIVCYILLVISVVLVVMEFASTPTFLSLMLTMLFVIVFLIMGTYVWTSIQYYNIMILIKKYNEKEEK